MTTVKVIEFGKDWATTLIAALLGVSLGELIMWLIGGDLTFAPAVQREPVAYTVLLVSIVTAAVAFRRFRSAGSR